MASEPTARITLKRLWWPPGDFLRSYKVMVDGKVVGWIRRRRTETFPVTPGHHEFQLEIDWCSSRTLELDLSPGEEVKLVCRARLPSTYAITRGRSDYIDLELAEA